MKKIPELDGNFLLKASCTGTGASFGVALMFILFHDKLAFSKDWISRIDLALAFFVVMFSVRMVIESMRFIEVLKKYPEDHLQEYIKENCPGIGSLNTFKKIVVSILMAIAFCFAVTLLRLASPPPLISAAAISFVLIAAVTEFFLTLIKKSRRK